MDPSWGGEYSQLLKQKKKEQKFKVNTGRLVWKMMAGSKWDAESEVLQTMTPSKHMSRATIRPRDELSWALARLIHVYDDRV